MIPTNTPCTADPRNAAFLDLLPRLQTHATIYFRYISCPQTRADKISETIALAWQWHLRLRERGKDVNRFVMVFVYLVAKAVKCGRRVTGMEKAKDVLSPRAQRRRGFTVTPLPASMRRAQTDLYGQPHGQERHDAFEERWQDDTQTPIPEQVAFRVDWPTFFATLPERDRGMAAFLALGHSAKHAATKFGISPGRVTQLRQGWCRAWQQFRGEKGNTPCDTPAACR